jgi:hypothetical protein
MPNRPLQRTRDRAAMSGRKGARTDGKARATGTAGFAAGLQPTKSPITRTVLPQLTHEQAVRRHDRVHVPGLALAVANLTVSPPTCRSPSRQPFAGRQVRACEKTSWANMREQGRDSDLVLSFPLAAQEWRFRRRIRALLRMPIIEAKGAVASLASIRLPKLFFHRPLGRWHGQASES